MRQTPRLAEWQTSLLAGLVVEGPEPDVRLAELATGVLARVLGDVYGSTVNIASRLTSVARPGSVVCCTGQPPT